MVVKPLSHNQIVEESGTGCNFPSMSLTSSSLLSISMEQPMSPKSPPPGLLDFYGKRKQIVKIQVLEREIGLLEEELKSLEGLHPASGCCKELDSFVGSISDPFISRNQTISKSDHFWKQIRSWICRPSSWLFREKIAQGCGCCRSSNCKCLGSSCFKTKCDQSCCRVQRISCKPCACCFTCLWCKRNVDHCCNCVQNCCHTCCQ